MESRNINLVDEHGISRVANVMFSFELSGSEYVAYWVERDDESNNVFVSKAVKEIDGSFSLLNIDDTVEKEKITLTVKEMIKLSLDSSAEVVPSNEVELSGYKVKLCKVSFNKEQNFNVSKTYVSTVKKEVTRVSDKFFDYKDNAVTENFSVPTEVFPEMPSVAPTVPSTPSVVESPVVAPTPVVEPTPVVPTASPIPTPVVVETPVANVNTVDATLQKEVVAPVANVASPVLDVPSSVVTPAPVQTVSVPSQPAVQDSMAAIPNLLEPTPAPISAPVAETPVVSVVTPEPVSVSNIVEPTPAPVVNNNELFFDASKESNLNAALGEAASAIPVADMAPVREFGSDDVVNVQPLQPTPAVPEAPVDASATTVPQENVPTGKMGFANGKFFTIVAIAFFLASCVFLGYEVFNYFQIAK